MAKSNKVKRCVYCGSDESLTIDHVIPKSKWREYNLKRKILNNKSNLVAACYRCNREKGAMTPDQWLDLHPEYRGRFLREAKFLSNPVKQASGLL